MCGFCIFVNRSRKYRPSPDTPLKARVGIKTPSISEGKLVERKNISKAIVLTLGLRWPCYVEPRTKRCSCRIGLAPQSQIRPTVIVFSHLKDLGRCL